MIGVDIKLNVTGEFKFLLDRLKDEKKTRKGIASSINRALAVAKRSLVAETVKITGIKNKKRIYKRITYVNATPESLKADVKIVGRPIAAINFPNIVTKSYGVAYRPTLNETQQWWHGFKGTGRVGKGEDPTKGNQHLFVRIQNTPHYVRNAHHTPNNYRKMDKIKALYGPRLSTIYNRNPSMKLLAAQASQKEFRRRVVSQLKRFLSKEAYAEMYFNQGVEFPSESEAISTN